ncbi:Fic family protein [Haloarcula sp. GH36]|uniref:Fic family protein n=1 Tax=Haloarcula montana TaxID=3111776 RepID=UPI002D7816DE|nr:Fic family protein [Haloarcula sp. GH36]
MKDGYDLPADAPGQYMLLRADERLSKAYFPDKLPPTLELSSAVVDEVARAMWVLGRLEGLGSEIDNPGAVFSSFVYKEAEQSSQVEGTAVTVSDLYRYDVDKLQIRETVESDHEADVREARNYITALDDAISFLQTAGIERESLTVELITSLHERLLVKGRSDGDDPLPGEFRPGYAVIEEQGPQGIGNRVRFVPPKPEMVPGLVDDLERFVQQGSEWPALVDIAIAHYQFETIHPFKDGNGRVGRLLVVLMLVSSGVLHYPMLYLSSYIERHRTEYADRLLAVSEEGAWDEWLQFFVRGIREQAVEAFVRAKLLVDKRNDYESRYADAAKSVRRLSLALFEDPYITVREASDRIDVVYQTANNAIETLESDGVVEEITGNQQNRVFRAAEIMDIVERPANALPNPDELVDIEQAWTLPEK